MKNRHARLIGSAIFSAAGAVALSTNGDAEKLLGFFVLVVGGLMFVGEWLVSLFDSDFWNEKYVVPLSQAKPKASSGDKPDRP